jgi:hypothetical protein
MFRPKKAPNKLSMISSGEASKESLDLILDDLRKGKSS